MHTPRILVTLDHSFKHNEHLFIRTSYLRAIEQAGGECVPVARPGSELVAETLRSVDGILLSGGDDVSPNYYHEEARPCIGKVDPTNRDQVEMEILQHAMDRKIPVLGICRGMQVMNVFFGGTLHQDIETDMEHGVKHNHGKDAAGEPLSRGHRAHDVHLDPTSRLFTITGHDILSVNSLHHQGVNVLGQDLRVSALTDEMLIEGIEHVAHPFMIGVQWHPEELDDEASFKLFEAFVGTARVHAV